MEENVDQATAEGFEMVEETTVASLALHKATTAYSSTDDLGQGVSTPHSEAMENSLLLPDRLYLAANGSDNSKGGGSPQPLSDDDIIEVGIYYAAPNDWCGDYSCASYGKLVGQHFFHIGQPPHLHMIAVVPVAPIAYDLAAVSTQMTARGITTAAR